MNTIERIEILLQDTNTASDWVMGGIMTRLVYGWLNAVAYGIIRKEEQALLQAENGWAPREDFIEQDLQREYELQHALNWAIQQMPAAYLPDATEFVETFIKRAGEPDSRIDHDEHVEMLLEEFEGALDVADIKEMLATRLNNALMLAERKRSELIKACEYAMGGREVLGQFEPTDMQLIKIVTSMSLSVDKRIAKNRTNMMKGAFMKDSAAENKMLRPLAAQIATELTKAERALEDNDQAKGVIEGTA